MPFEVEVQAHQVVFRIHDTRPDVIRALVALHERYLRTGLRVIVPVMPVVESVAFVVTETVVFHHVAHPFEVRDKHLLHIYVVVTPVTRTIPVLAVIIVTGSRTPACSRTRVLCRRLVPVRIHLVVPAYIRCIGIELTVLAKVHLRKVAPARPTRTVVNHDIRYHFRSRFM